MPTLQGDDIADLVALTLRNLGRYKYEDLVSDLQEYTFARLMKKEQTSVQSGYGFQWQVLTETAGTARNIGLYQVDNTHKADGIKQGNVPWRHCETSMIIDKIEIAMNRTPSRIVDVVKVGRSQAMIDWAKLLEQNLWTKPTDSSDDKQPFGIPYWLVKNATEGFNGGNPSGFSDGAGNINSTTVSNWKNYTAQYATVSKSDLIKKWRKAATFTRFMPPAKADIPSYSTGRRYGYYTVYSVIASLEEILESQNDNLGNDVASKDGDVMFRRVPVTWVPFLDPGQAGADSQNPIYGINWGTFKLAFLRGRNMVQTGPRISPTAHNVLETFWDSSYNLVCTNRRENSVLATA